ncbi:M28 family metallopeptidase [Prauserella halophila]|uniref:M28 family metallopeptidase n=1 Tax=Prauserella halophila TaxID=185641 RepID=A0ABP4HAJ0_9PSEU|nr:M28 family metallopeptidase [Prauserella halophila]MCP2237713.1 aminopeptidase Y [Prauserella halophila]
MSFSRGKLRSVTAIAACAGLVLTGTATAQAAPKSLPDELPEKVELGSVQRHLIAMQRIADVHDGNRAAGSMGHETSAEYMAQRLERAGYDITRQQFPFTYTETLAEKLTVGGEDAPIVVMEYSKNTEEGGMTAPVAAIEPDDTPGCEAADYGDVTGRIAVVKRGACSFAAKQAAAAEAGAAAAIVYNNESGPLNGTLGDADSAVIPTGGVSQEAGKTLVDADGQDVTLELRQLQEERTTYNVIAETTTGRDDNVVMAGAHLDGVTDGAGINDNGTGSAALLETALQLGGSPEVNNKVRFAWWSAEEFGLVGSTHYVNSLSQEQQLDIAMYLNFDMIGSPNAGYFTLDGDDSEGEGAGPGPYGSAQIEKAFEESLAERGVEAEGSDFTGRSDYGEFIAYGIPAGGLFTGAEDVKTEEQAAKWGGTAGEAYDPCYHTACDNLGNVDYGALDVNADAMAQVTAQYALSTEDVNHIAPAEKKNRAQVAKQRSADKKLPAVANERAHEATA